MIGLDTSVVLRLLLSDDPAQKIRAANLIQQAKRLETRVIITLAVVLEVEWVLRSSAKMNKAQILNVFNLLLESYDVEVEDEKVLEQALHIYDKAAADFAECLFLAQYQRMGCSAMLTFDAKAAGMTGAELVAG
jgi:predicted nucleic-acid-binding protein